MPPVVLATCLVDLLSRATLPPQIVIVRSPDTALPSNVIVSSIAEVLETESPAVSCAAEDAACARQEVVPTRVEVLSTKVEVLEEEEVANKAEVLAHPKSIHHDVCSGLR
jgi:hypothetical protein